MTYLKAITLGFSLVVLSALAVVGLVGAQSFRNGDNVSVSRDETIDSSLYVSGGNINIAGNIEGDVFCAGQNVTISGSVQGDVFCAGQTITISGEVEGGVRLAGQSITLSGQIGTSATVASQNLTIENDANITRDLTGGSQNITINGQVGRDMIAGADVLTINGRIGRNIKGGVNSINVGSGGVVGGDVNYTGTNDPNVSSGGNITGEVIRHEPKDEMQKDQPNLIAFVAGSFIYMLITMLVVGLVLVALFPHVLESSAVAALASPGKAILVGLLAVIVVPVVIFLLFATVIGIPLAILALFIWITILLLSGLFAAYMLGKALLNNSTHPVWIMALGVLILVVTYFIPVIGFITFILTILFGTGMILMQSRALMPARTETVRTDTKSTRDRK